MADETIEPRWLEWARRLQAISQSGLTYTQNKFDVERWEEIRDIAAQMMVCCRDNVTADRFVREFGEQYGYATPKIDVRGVVVRGDKILLVREQADQRWSLPGGWADVGDTPSQAVAREIREEAGLESRAVRLLAVYDRRMHDNVPWLPFHLYKMFFLCEAADSARPAPGPETLAADFFPLDRLPELSLGRVTEKQIQRMFELYRRPELPADFD
jgi:ADP-ribose pyrophosphatase YjhB (NUDIX family)